MWRFIFSCFFLIVYSTNLQQSSPISNGTLSSNKTIPINQTPKPRMVTYCETPNKDIGYCMPIRNCTKLEKLLDNKHAQEFLNESRCGPQNKHDMICCGKYSDYKLSELPETCGIQNVTIRGRILGGKEAKLGEFPWLARLYHRNKRGVKNFGCTGFLISSKFVLTAAHCLKSENHEIMGPIYEVHLGEHDTQTEIDCNKKNTTCADKVQKIKVAKTIVHHSYDSSSRHHHHDIGLIYLNKGAKIGSYIQPICIFDKSQFQPFEYWLSGWGATNNENLNDLSSVKMKVSVPPFPLKNCSQLYQTIGTKITDNQICAGGKANRDSCVGDSGGPLMFVNGENRWIAAGVVSFGVRCGLPGHPAVYTNISSYENWIKKAIRKNQKNKTKSV